MNEFNFPSEFTEKGRNSIAGEEFKPGGTQLNCVGYRSRPGRDYTGARKTNQDSYICVTSALGKEDYHFVGVYDGHGMNGHFASAEVKRILTEYFTDKVVVQAISTDTVTDLFSRNEYAFLKDAYFESEEVLKKASFDCKFSGTTAVTVILVGDRVFCLNAGDSRAILVNTVGN